VHGSGNRFVRYKGAGLSESGWLRDVAEIGAAKAPLHPSDVAALVVPLDDTIAGGTHSVVYVAAPAESFDEGRMRQVAVLADIASPLYALARAREDDQTKANYDPLTGLTNKATFHLRLEQAAASGKKIVLAFIDGDNFKLWNDTYGHASGDACIDRLGQVIREYTLSHEDIVGRMGGDEFAIAFVGATKSDAVAQCVRICGGIESDDRRDIVPADKVAADRDGIVGITGSIGVAALGDDATNSRELLAAADRAMYRAKGNALEGYEPVVPGKNTVCYWVDGEIVEVGAHERARILDQRAVGGLR
jgi:diguanylate cyclase (GGDEF)-like protein